MKFVHFFKKIFTIMRKWMNRVIAFIVLLALGLPHPAYTNEGLSPEIAIVPSQSHHISRVTINKTQNLLFSGSQNGTIKVWRLNSDEHSGFLIRTINTGDLIWDIASTEDGSVVASAHEDIIRLWNTETGNLIKVLSLDSESEHRIRSVVFLKNKNNLLASASNDGVVRIWNLEIGSVSRTLIDQESGFWTIGLSPDGSLLYAGDNAGVAKIWSLSNDRLVLDKQVSSGPVRAIDIDIANQFIATGGGINSLDDNNDNTVRIWEIQSGDLVNKFETPPIADRFVPDITSLRFSPDGKNLLIGSQRSSLRGLSNDFLVHDFGFDYASEVFLNGGKHFITFGFDTINIRSSENGQRVGTLGGKTAPQHWLDISPNAEFFVSSDEERVSIWSTATGKQIASRALDFSKSSGGVAVKFHETENFFVLHYNNGRTGFLEVLDYPSFDVRWRNFYRFDRRVTKGDAKISISKDGGTIYLIDSTGILRIFDLDDDINPKKIEFRDEFILAVKPADMKHEIKIISRGPESFDDLFSSATNNEKSKYHLLNYNLRENVKKWSEEIKSSEYFFKVFSFDTKANTFLTHEQSIENPINKIVLREDKTGKAIKTYNINNNYSVREISPLNRSIAFLDDYTNYPNIGNGLASLDLETGNLISVFRGHNERIREINVSKNQRYVISTADDGTKIWDSKSGKLLATYLISSNGEWLTITPEGFFAGSENGHELLSVVRGLEVYSIDQFFDALYDPELVKEKLAGDPNNKVLKAANKLDLEKILETGGPPRVKIISPSDGTDVHGDVVDIEVEVEENGGGIGRIEFFVNGVNKGRVLAGAGGTVLRSKELSLASEVNKITVVAYNRRNLIASRPAEITVKVDKAIVAKQPTLHILAVGVENYADSKYRLNYAADDVDALERAFDAIRKNDTQYRDVKFYPLLNENVTKANLETQFEALSENVQAHDVFMFFISGHGTAIGRKYFFIPPEFDVADRELIDAVIEDGISQDNWRDWLGTIKAEKSLLIYDTCEAGDLTEVLGRGFGDDNVAAEKLARATGRALLTASGPSALALEGYRQQGLLTYALLEGMAVADKDNNGVGLRELFDHVGDRVPQLSQAITTNNVNFTEPYIQKPRRLLRGDDFTLASKPITGILNIDVSPPIEIIPTTPTHITTGPTKVYKEPDINSEVIRELQKYTLITKVGEDRSWTLIAKDGREIGFIKSAAVEAVQ